MIDDLLRKLCPTIEGKYLKRRSIIDYSEAQINIEITNNSIYIFFSSGGPTPCEQKNADPTLIQFWPETLVIISFIKCEDEEFNLDFNYPYLIHTIIYKKIKGSITEIGNDLTLSNVYLEMRNLKSPWYNQCCDGTYVPNPEKCLDSCFITFQTVILFKQQLENFFNSSYQFNFINGSNLDQLEFFQDKGLVSIPECDDQLTYYLTINNKVDYSRYVITSPLDIDTPDDYFISEEFFNTININYSNVKQPINVTVNNDYPFIKIVEFDLVDQSELIQSDPQCCNEFVINIKDCRVDPCQSRQPGYYANLTVLNYEFDYVRIADPLFTSVSSLIGKLIPIVSALIPGVIISYNDETESIIINDNGNKASVEIIICPCPAGTTWNVRTQSCCQI